MIKIENEKNIPAYLAKHARDFCAKISATEIYNVAVLGDGDYRIMYWIEKGGKLKMEATILKTPNQA